MEIQEIQCSSKSYRNNKMEINSSEPLKLSQFSIVSFGALTNIPEKISDYLDTQKK
jgi:hypothetical protein